MRYVLQQKLFSLGDDYFIKDDAGHAATAVPDDAAA